VEDERQEPLRPGDVVRVRPGTKLCEEFSSAYGYGPFIVSSRAFGEGDTVSWYLVNMDGSPQPLPSGTLIWHSREEILQRDEFLTAVRRANNGT
jgi:hypothetical protein